MTYTKVANGLLVGTSSDTKPTTYADKTIFYETNTGAWYVSTTGSWTIATGPSVTETLINKTMSGAANTFTNIGSGALPATVVYTGQANTYGAFDQVIPGGNLKLSASSFKTTIAATPTANRTITIPDITDTLVGQTTTDTLTNKTLTSPHISTIVNTGTLTLPTSTDTLVGRTTTDTLTSKTIDASSNTISNIVNANVSASAAIVWTKISKTGSVISDIGNVVITSPSSGQVLTYNGTNWINQTSSGGFTEAKGITTPSNGDASTKVFTISHGLGSSPSWYSAIPASADAADDFYLTASSTVITITYNFAPPSGTSNLSWIWRATV